MGLNLITKNIKIGGMTCVSCGNRIERKLNKTYGVEKATVNYNNQKAKIIYDADVVSVGDIIKVVEGLDYKVIEDGTSDKPNILYAALIIFGLYIMMDRFGLNNMFNQFPQAKEGMGLGMLFLIGVMTSVHCVAMCGGINLSQCIPKSIRPSSKDSFKASVRPSLLYNLGRVIAYTMIGAIVGALGSAISFSGQAKGVVQLAAGVFMVIMGLNMLNIFQGLRMLIPRMPRIFAKMIHSETHNNSPLYVGLLNGLMPCGPLQAMQLYALSTGDPLKGAFSMLLFSLGTVPLMFGLGALSSILSQNFTKKAMSVGAVLVVVLGISMFSSGISLSGLGVPSTIFTSGPGINRAKVKGDVQIVNTSLDSGRYEPITLKAGVPVRWTIHAGNGSVNGCNNAMVIPEFNIEKNLDTGDNVIEFMPTKAGVYTYSCWMGMIRSTITVED